MDEDIIEKFDAEVDLLFDRAVPSSFWKCRAIFCNLISSDILSLLLKEQLRDSPLYKNLSIAYNNDSIAWITFSSGVRLGIHLLEPGYTQADLTSHTSDLMIGFISGTKDSCLIIERYEHDESYVNTNYNIDCKLRGCPDQYLSEFQVEQIRAGVQVYRVKSVSHPMALYTLYSPAIYDFHWEYEPTSLHPVKLICSNISAYRLFFASKLLGSIVGPGNKESLLAISRHQSHFVRWAAIQSLFHVSYEAAVQRLTEAQKDAHPLIRAASIRAIRSLPHTHTPKENGTYASTRDA